MKRRKKSKCNKKKKNIISWVVVVLKPMLACLLMCLLAFTLFFHLFNAGAEFSLSSFPFISSSSKASITNECLCIREYRNESCISPRRRPSEAEPPSWIPVVSITSHLFFISQKRKKEAHENLCRENRANDYIPIYKLSSFWWVTYCLGLHVLLFVTYLAHGSDPFLSPPNTDFLCNNNNNILSFFLSVHLLLGFFKYISFLVCLHDNTN